MSVRRRPSKRQVVSAERAIVELTALAEAVSHAAAARALFHEERARWNALRKTDPRAASREIEDPPRISTAPVYRVKVLAGLYVGLVYEAYVHWRRLAVPDERVEPLTADSAKIRQMKGYRNVAFHSLLPTDKRALLFRGGRVPRGYVGEVFSALKRATRDLLADRPAYCRQRGIEVRDG